MKYRQFGKLKWKVSALGFGTMRLPVIGADRGNIDEPEAIKMVRYAIDKGVNYLDTAYPYHNGNSEKVVGKALQDGYRDKVKLATKMPIWQATSHADLDTIFQEQLSRLQTETVNFYLFHNLNKDNWAKTQELNALRWAENKIDEGRIEYLGFSFHDDYDVFTKIIDGYPGWTFCQILYNYLDTAHQAGVRGLQYAASHDLAVVAMEPIAGGRLAVPPPAAIQTVWDTAKIERSPADLALQWVWEHPEVSVALSGMSTMQHVVENVDSANRSGQGTLTATERDLIIRVKEQYTQHGYIGCTNCGYCQPCPEGVDIPTILALINEYYKVRGDQDAQQTVVKQYHHTIPPEKGLKSCVNCGDCETKCPQQLPVSSLIQSTDFTFERSRQNSN